MPVTPPVTPPETPTRPMNRTRRNLQLDFGPVPSPDYNASPISMNDEEQFNNLLQNAQLHFDPEGLADELGNAEIILEPMDEFEQEIIYEEVPTVPVEDAPAVPIEYAPAVNIENAPEIDFDQVIRINFSISFFNDAFIEEGEDALDAALDRISNGPASPPDVDAYIQMDE